MDGGRDRPLPRLLWRRDTGAAGARADLLDRARVSDAIRLGERSIDAAGWITFRQQKTGGEVWVPYSRRLPEFTDCMAGDLDALRAAVAARPERHLTFMVTQAGKSRSSRAVSQWFAAKARAAGISKSAHGLRKSRTIALVEAGATTHQVGAWTGHESLSEIANYARKFGRRKALSRKNENEKFQPGGESSKTGSKAEQ